MRRVVAVVAVLVAVAGVSGACGDAGAGTPSVSVDRARVPAPAGANAAFYFDVANQGDGADRLLEARTDAADGAELHRTAQGDDGLMRMEPVDEVEVGVGDTVSFEPGGLHVMLLGVEPLAEGDVVEVELEFAESGIVSVEAEVGPVTGENH